MVEHVPLVKDRVAHSFSGIIVHCYGYECHDEHDFVHLHGAVVVLLNVCEELLA